MLWPFVQSLGVPWQDGPGGNSREARGFSRRRLWVYAGWVLRRSSWRVGAAVPQQPEAWCCWTNLGKVYIRDVKDAINTVLMQQLGANLFEFAVVFRAFTASPFLQSVRATLETTRRRLTTAKVPQVNQTIHH